MRGSGFLVLDAAPCLSRHRRKKYVSGENGTVTDIRRKVDELAVRWKMKDPGRADQTTEYSSVPLMSSVDDDADDQVRGDLFCFTRDYEGYMVHATPPGGVVVENSTLHVRAAAACVCHVWVLLLFLFRFTVILLRDADPRSE